MQTMAASRSRRLVRGTPRFSGPLSPTPMPSLIRPGASSSSVAMALAITLGWRPVEMADRAGAKVDPLGRDGQRPEHAMASRTARCESVIQNTSKPSRSAKLRRLDHLRRRDVRREADAESDALIASRRPARSVAPRSASAA